MTAKIKGRKQKRPDQFLSHNAPQPPPPPTPSLGSARPPNKRQRLLLCYNFVALIFSPDTKAHTKTQPSHGTMPNALPAQCLWKQQSGTQCRQTQIQSVCQACDTATFEKVSSPPTTSLWLADSSYRNRGRLKYTLTVFPACAQQWRSAAAGLQAPCWAPQTPLVAFKIIS